MCVTLEAEGPVEYSVPTIAYYMGVPLSEMPREELEATLCDAYQQIETLRHELCTRSVEHINDLAAMARRR